jgi:hypothetical protein
MAKVPGTRSGRRASSTTDEYSEVEARLPRLIKLAFDAYCARASAPEPENTKEFVAGQAACRAALAHFMLLVRLSDRLSRRKEPTADAQDAIENMILEARAALGDKDPV